MLSYSRLRNTVSSFVRPGLAKPSTRRYLAKLADSLEEAIEIAKREKGNDGIFIVGGGQIFEQALSLADKLYLTIVRGDFGADTFFPDYAEFKKRKVIGEGESEGHKYTFLELER